MHFFKRQTSTSLYFLPEILGVHMQRCCADAAPLRPTKTTKCCKLSIHLMSGFKLAMLYHGIPKIFQLHRFKGTLARKCKIMSSKVFNLIEELQDRLMIIVAPGSDSNNSLLMKNEVSATVTSGKSNKEFTRLFSLWPDPNTYNVSVQPHHLRASSALIGPCLMTPN